VKKLKRLFVTGGAGFIGQHLIAMFLERSWEVRSYDLELIKNLEHPLLSQIEGDICNQESLITAMKDCDVVVHLAAQVSVQSSMENPTSTLKVNVEGTANVIHACREHAINRLIVASSAAIYGDVEHFPLLEEHAGRCLSPYAESKWENEQQVLEARKEGMEAIALRFFNVYGSGQPTDKSYAAVIPKFVETICEGRAPTLFGDGQNSRDFIHVRDVAAAMYEFAEEPWRGADFHAYNLATQKETSLLELIDLINQSMKRKYPQHRPLKPEYQPQRSGDIVRSLASIERVCSVVDWRPRIAFADGIDEMVRDQLLGM
tara:strand:+ start:3030 stop:3980 length:951 start_codon:yes stop_codon:yes gene_type:complete